MNDQAETLRKLKAGQQGLRPNPARVIAIASGKGGVGKTNLAVNLGTCLARMGQRTALLDGDLGMANVDIILGLTPPFNIADVVAGRKKLLDIVTEGPAGLQVFSGGSGLYEMANLGTWQLESFARSFADLDDVYDFLLVDTGAGLSQGVIRLVLSAAEVVVVTTPEPTALADAYGIVKVVARRSPGTTVHVAVNMVRREEEGDALFAHFQRATQRFLQVDLGFLGAIPSDPLVGRAVQEQVPFIEAYPHCKAAKAVEGIARSLLGQQVATAGGIRGLFSRMSRMLRQGP